jgi:hypothetical protein
MRAKRKRHILPALGAVALMGLLAFPAEAAKPPPRTYVGEAVCANCHLGKHEGWIQTAHEQIVRDGSLESSYINDGNSTGRCDFFDPGKFPLSICPAATLSVCLGPTHPSWARTRSLGLSCRSAAQSTRSPTPSGAPPCRTQPPPTWTATAGS